MRVPGRLRLAAAVVAVAIGAAAVAGCGTLRAKALLEDAIGPPAALRDDVEEVDETVDVDGTRVPVRITRPADAEGPLPAFVLCHGAAAGGAADARMVAFARAIAARGATVAAPDLASLRTFRLDEHDPARLAGVALRLADDEELTQDGRVAFVGICVGGSYALLAAADERIQGRVSAVLTFGAYDDLESLLFTWMTEPAAHPDLFDPLTEGRRLVLLGNLDPLVPEDDRAGVRRAIDALQRGADAQPIPADASLRTAAVLAAANSDQPLDGDAARALLAPLAGPLAALSPARAVLPADVDVYLLHGTTDPVVPVADAALLADRLRGADSDADVEITDLFEHVDANRPPGFFEALSLLFFFDDFLDDAGL